jgi:hypothetical protein
VQSSGVLPNNGVVTQLLNGFIRGDRDLEARR